MSHAWEATVLPLNYTRAPGERSYEILAREAKLAPDGLMSLGGTGRDARVRAVRVGQKTAEPDGARAVASRDLATIRHNVLTAWPQIRLSIRTGTFATEVS